MFNMAITLDENSVLPLYEQLYKEIVRQIREGVLHAMDKLPSKRVLQQELKISHSTVETCYSILMAEGYIESIPRVGYRVCEWIPFNGKKLKPSEEQSNEASKNADAVTQTLPKASLKHAFSTGAVDTEIFPYSSWAKIYREVVYHNPELLQRGDPQGDEYLRETLSAFLNEFRGVSCKKEQIVIGAGVEYLLDRIMRLFPERQRIAVEDPGYPISKRVMNDNHKIIVPVEIDEYGIDPNQLEKIKDPIGMVYVTPSHQFPTGVTMPPKRRGRLIQWAKEHDAYILEDDYDSEFRYRSRPLKALQGLDEHGRVIYIGTFSRSIAPSIRAAFMVLPDEVLSRHQRQYGKGSCTVSRFEQQVLSEFIKRGLYERHLRRCTMTYKKRAQALESRLAQIDGAYVTGEGAGLHMLLHLPKIHEKDLRRELSKRDFLVHFLREYRFDPSKEESPVLVLGFADLTEERIDSLVKDLCEAIESAKK